MEQESAQSMEQSIELNSSASQEHQSSVTAEENVSTMASRPRRRAATEVRSHHCKNNG